MRGERDWQSERLRYLVHFLDGGAGTRYLDTQLDVGAELSDGGQRYAVERVEPPPNRSALGHAWAKLIERA
jgi:hypothetical protein